MAGMKALREKAKKAGIPVKEIRAAESSAELRKMIAEASNGTAKKSTARKAVAKATKKATRGRGRPKGSTSKAKPAAKRGRPAKAATKRTPAKRNSGGNGNGGRNMLEGIRWSNTDGWNPREGSVPDVIVKSLRKFKGDRDKVFNALKGKLDSMVPKKTRDGRTRNKEERLDYLRYLISRNAWAFALATGQHESSSNRVEYGTGGTGEGLFKRNKKRSQKASKPAAKRGRPKGSKSARKPAGAKRGRPKGSKNKSKSRR